MNKALLSRVPMETVTFSSSTNNKNQTKDFLTDVIHGLSQSTKTLPFKYLYDAKGSDLFEAITQLDSYYITQTEKNIMQQYTQDIAASFQSSILLVELGSGSSVKTKLLLDELSRHEERSTTFIPIDISRDFLFASCEKMHDLYHKTIQIIPIAGDFREGLKWASQWRKKEQLVVYFPGSTIGNFEETEAKNLIQFISNHMKSKDLFVISTDLIKDEEILYKAYNDPNGLTAAFILNILHRINRELKSDFNLKHFQYKPFYNKSKQRMEMHLQSLKPQTIHLQDKSFVFQQAETIHVESSHKYSKQSLLQLCEHTQLHLQKMWVDKQQFFSINLLQK